MYFRDDQPFTHRPATIELRSLNDDSFQMNVEGKFFNDPPNPGGVAGEPFMGLWDFEGYIWITNVYFRLAQKCKYHYLT